MQQVEGQKHNFSQPFSTFWDKICGTYSEQFAHPPHGLGLPKSPEDEKLKDE
jgi:sterol desaturase/sphingolipid hydroxylase (fatty acid hydroxylase superfamily)